MRKGEPQFRMTGVPKATKPKGPMLKYTGEETEPKTTEDKKVHVNDPRDERWGLSFCGTKMVPWGRKMPKKLTGKENLDDLVDNWHYCKRCLNSWMLHYGIIFK